MRSSSKRLIKASGLVLLLLSATTLAHTDPKKHEEHPWHGTNLSLGIVNNTGNTEQTDFNIGTNVQYQKARWKNVFNLQAQLTVNQKVINKEQVNVNDQVNYSFGQTDRNYIYGATMFAYNRFAPYEYQSTTGVGYGRYIFKDELFNWSVQVGPALRYDQTQTEHEGMSKMIAQVGTNVSWKITENLKVSEVIRYDLGSPYNYLNSVITLNTRLAGHWSLLLSYMIEYYSSIPRGSTDTRKLDTTATLAVAYNL